MNPTPLHAARLTNARRIVAERIAPTGCRYPRRNRPRRHRRPAQSGLDVPRLATRRPRAEAVALHRRGATTGAGDFREQPTQDDRGERMRDDDAQRIIIARSLMWDACSGDEQAEWLRKAEDTLASLDLALARPRQESSGDEGQPSPGAARRGTAETGDDDE